MRIAALGLALLVSLNAAAATHPDMPKQWTGKLPVAPAFLHRQLPPNIVAYARVPNLLGLLTMPKGSQLDAALRSDANIDNVRNIQNGIAQNVLSLPAFSDPRLKFLADAVRSPIEVAAFGIPNPALLIGATLKARTKTEFNQLFDNPGQGGPPVRLAAPLDTQGISELMGLPLPVFVKFDPTTGRLLLFAAQRLDRLEFEQFLADLPKEVKDHPMYALEQKIDASGQGLFLWVNANQLLPLVQARSAGIAQTLGRLGLGGMRAVAFGFGTANGKGRLSLVVDAGDDHAKRPFPVVTNNVTATAVGNPDAAVLVSLPSKAEFDRLESMWEGGSSTESRGGWEKFKAGFRDRIGVNIGELFAAIGPDIDILFDQAGDYTAVHLRDPVLFDELVRRIAAKTGSAPDERIIGGTTFHHWRLPALLSLNASAGTANQTAQGKSIAALLGKLHNHVYWIHEGEYLYVASAPQPLIDRVHKGATTHVATWLATRQRMDTSTSLFAATASVAKLPRRTYQAYLSLLQSLADVTDSKVDIWSMPTADQLALPRNGTVGVSLNSGERYISLELTYGDHPGELLLGGGGFGAVAAVGIMAAIAIPAYQDYTIRAQVTEGLNLALPAESAIAASFVAQGIMPKDRSAAGLPSSPEVPTARYVERLEVSGGVITMTFGKASNAAIRGKTLTLTPIVTTGRDIVWRCGYAKSPAGATPIVPDDSGASTGTTIPSKYLPSMCR